MTRAFSILRTTLCCAAAVAISARAAAQEGAPPPAEEPQELPKAAPADRPLRVVPSLMGYDRIVRDLSAPIVDEARREELKTQVARLWDGYNTGWQRVESNEIQIARLAVSELNGRQPPSPETLRSRMADALAAVNRSDAAFFLALSEVIPPESREALESLKRARTRAICGHGMAPQLAFAVPFRLIDPMRWLDASTVEVPEDARREYDTRMTALVERWSAARRAFEFQALARGRGSKEFEAMLPSASRELLTISQTMGSETAAEVARLSSALPPAEVARIQIARIEAIYFDTPRPERPAVLDALPTDPTAHDAWIAERERTLVADAEILLRYEKRAIETMFAAPFSSRGAYDTRRKIADPYREERTRLHDQAAERQKVISGAQAGG
ncbi:MAG: hypothetical protein LW636_06020 [Planctomycetaceae bacterium]|nr:hypothetical protein [Planctomycetaceae bacterium]